MNAVGYINTAVPVIAPDPAIRTDQFPSTLTRSITMNTMHEALSRDRMHEREHQARQARLARELVSQRLRRRSSSRRSEAAPHQVRVAPAHR